jgi:orotate phosphoribosyltransferase|tara:strand:+ start:301 stop:816 length:516 start_codon:yes stop_codon:yes gene_type:complete
MNLDFKNMLKDNAVEYGDFILSSGKKSKFYIDIKKAYTKPEVLKEITKKMEKLIINKKIDKIAGVAVGAVPLATSLSLKTGIPFLIIRKDVKRHGTEVKIEGRLKAGETVLIVEDVTTTGETVVKAANLIRKVNAICDKVIVVVDREEGAEKNLADNNLSLMRLSTSSELV